MKVGFLILIIVIAGPRECSHVHYTRMHADTCASMYACVCARVYVSLRQQQLADGTQTTFFCLEHWTRQTQGHPSMMNDDDAINNHLIYC